MPNNALTDWLTLADAKLHLRVESDDADELVTDAIAQGVDFVAHATGRKLVGADSETVSERVRLAVIVMTRHAYEGPDAVPETLRMMLSSLRKQF